MKILLDECVTRKLKNYLTDFEVFTVAQMSWSGLKNGNLMKVAIENQFDVFLTVDKNLEFQQTVSNYDISLVVFDVEKSTLEYLEELIPTFKEKSTNFKKGKVYRITKNN